MDSSETKPGHVPVDLPSALDRSPMLPGMEDPEADIVPAGEDPRGTMGIFSAARFFDRRPDTYRQIARAIFEGLPDAAIGRIFSVHTRTAAAIRAREERSTSAESYRVAQARRIRKVTAAAVDRIAEKIEKDGDDISAKDLAYIADRLGQQERVLEGAPTAIVGVLRPDGAAARLAYLLASGIGSDPENIVGHEGAPARELAEPEDVVMLPDPDADEGDTNARFHEGALRSNDLRANDTEEDTNGASKDASCADLGHAAEQAPERASGALDSAARPGGGGGAREEGGPFPVDALSQKEFLNLGGKHEC